jgi:hypothetical protein
MVRIGWILTALLLYTVLAVTTNMTETGSDSCGNSTPSVITSESDIRPIHYSIILADFREESSNYDMEVADARSVSAISYTQVSSPVSKNLARTEIDSREADNLNNSVCLGCAFPDMPVTHDALQRETRGL